MTIEELLSNKLINRAELARQLWPHDKNAPARLAHKIKGDQGQALTGADKDEIKNILIYFKINLEDIQF